VDCSLQALAETGFDAWLNDQPNIIAVDTETTGLGYFDTPFCTTIAWDRDDGDVVGHYFELVDYDSSWMVSAILQATPTWIGHNIKFDLQKLVQAGILDREAITADRLEDTETLAHLLDAHQKKGLKSLARTHLGVETTEDEELAAVRRKLKLRKEDGYHVLPREVVIPYAIQDVILTLGLFDLFHPKLQDWPELVALYAHEKLVTLALLDMEGAGMALDMDYLSATAKAYGKEAVRTELRIRDLTTEEFNPGSWQQILARFEEEGITLEGTDKDTLSQVDHDLAREILHLRSTRKMHGTYLQPMLNEQEDGIIHPNFRQHGTKTGRMSSGESEG
jgi:DNA polymerase-1